MCNKACIDALADWIDYDDVVSKEIIEAGARDVNGSIRPYIEGLNPRRYLGVDIMEGHRVDELCDAENLVAQFGEQRFDGLISTEMLEHVENWRIVISNFKRILRPGGWLAITTRSEGFPYHEYPGDFWRYEIEDMRAIFADFEILRLQADPSEPGVFIKARRPDDFQEINLDDYHLYSIQSGQRED